MIDVPNDIATTTVAVAGTIAVAQKRIGSNAYSTAATIAIIADTVIIPIVVRVLYVLGRRNVAHARPPTNAIETRNTVM